MGKEALKSVFDLIKQSPNRNYRLLAKIETGVRGWVGSWKRKKARSISQRTKMAKVYLEKKEREIKEISWVKEKKIYENARIMLSEARPMQW